MRNPLDTKQVDRKKYVWLKIIICRKYFCPFAENSSPESSVHSSRNILILPPFHAWSVKDSKQLSSLHNCCCGCQFCNHRVEARLCKRSFTWLNICYIFLLIRFPADPTCCGNIVRLRSLSSVVTTVVLVSTSSIVSVQTNFIFEFWCYQG